MDTGTILLIIFFIIVGAGTAFVRYVLANIDSDETPFQLIIGSIIYGVFWLPIWIILIGTLIFFMIRDSKTNQPLV